MSNNIKKIIHKDNVNKNDNMSREKIMHIYQYVLGTNVGIVRNELYEYLILRVLFDHGVDSELNNEEIKEHIEKDYELKNIPDIHLEPALERLKQKKYLIEDTEYSLSADKRIEIRQHNASFEDYAKNISDDLKQQIETKIPDISETLRESVVKNFYKLLAKTFTTHGKIAAKLIIDKKSMYILKKYKGFKFDYDILVLNDIPKHLRQKIDNLFNEFFVNPTEERSKFFYVMAQSHTLLEILNIDPNLKQLQKNALYETKLFLDTNILISMLFDNKNSSINTILMHAKQLGAKLVINDITEKEFNMWLDHSKKEVSQITNISKELSNALFNKKLNAPLFTAYIESRNEHSRQTIEQFCLQFASLPELLREKYDVLYDKMNMMEVKKNQKFKKLKSRVFGYNNDKAPNVVLHDVSCILKVKEYRKRNHGNTFGPKAWFLTLDNTLSFAEQHTFDKQDIQSSIIPSVFLQTISPLISPDLKTEYTTKSFMKLLGANFGIGSVIKQDDILNITAAFYDLEHVDEEKLGEIIGDEVIRKNLRQVRKAHNMNNAKAEKKWEIKSVNSITDKLAGKHDAEINKYNKTLKNYVEQIDRQKKDLSRETRLRQKKETEISELHMKHEKDANTHCEKIWKIKFFVLLVIGILITIATTWFTQKIIDSTWVAGCGIIIGIAVFSTWYSSHHK